MNGKKTLVFLLKLSAILLIFGFLFYRASKNDVLDDLFLYPIVWNCLALAFVLNLSATLLTMIRWFFLTRALGLSLSCRDAVRLGFIGFMFNFAPMGILGGDLVKGYLLTKKNPGQSLSVAASVIMDRVIGLYVMFLIGAGFVGFSGFYQNSSITAQTASHFCFAAALISTVGLTVLFFPERQTHWRQRLIEKTPFLGKTLKNVWNACVLYRQFPAVILFSTAMTVLVHALFALSLWMTALGIFSKAPCLSDHFILYPLANMGSMIPLSVGPLEVFLDQLYPLFPLQLSLTLPSFFMSPFSSIQPFDDHSVLSRFRCLVDNAGGSVSDRIWLYKEGMGMMIGVVFRFITLLVASVGGIYYLSSKNDVREALKNIEQKPDVF